MRSRALLCAVVLAVTGAPAALAAPKAPATWCLGVTDDVSPVNTLAPAPGQSLDIVALRAEATRAELVATLRVPAMSSNDDALRRAGGFEWLVNLEVDGVDYRFRYRHTSAFADDRQSSAVTAGAVPLRHVIAVGRDGIVWKVRRADLPRAAKPSKHIVLAAATTSWAAAVADTAIVSVPRSAPRGC